MSNGQIAKRWIEDNAVGNTKYRGENNTSLRWRNAADSGDINVILVNASNVPVFQTLTQHPFVPLANDDIANKAYVDAAITPVPTEERESFTLNGADITNGYIDLANEAIPESVYVAIEGAGSVLEGTDYTLSVEAGPITRITWSIALAAILIVGDKVQVQYRYL